MILERERPSRFNTIKRNLSGIRSRSLSERLDELEKEGIIKRVVTNDIPPRVEYYLTDKDFE
ncbi:MAG: winged helix-turn-helix transcriptional regulator, partial [Nitrososphaeria archaeon]